MPFRVETSEVAPVANATVANTPVSNIDKIVASIAAMSIDDVSKLFLVAAYNAKDLQSIFNQCAEMHRKKFLQQAQESKDLQTGKASHALNLLGAALPAAFEDNKIVGKAVGGATTAAGNYFSTNQQSQSAYVNAQKDGVSQMMQNAYADVSRTQQQSEQFLQTIASVISAMQQAKAAMMR